MVDFPIINIRKNIDGTWNLVYITEVLTVPSTYPYVCRLKEVPDNGLIESPPSIPGLLISETYPPTTGYCYINFANGYIEFNSAQAGNVYTVGYWGKGHLMDAYHINWLYDNKVNLDSTGGENDIAIFTNSNTITGTKTLDLGTF